MKILFVTLSNVGDVVLTLPGLDLLREAFPGAQLTVLAGPRAAGIFEGNSSISRFIAFDKHGPFKKKLELFLALRSEGFDLVVDLRNALFGRLLGKAHIHRMVARRALTGHFSRRHLQVVRNGLLSIWQSLRLAEGMPSPASLPVSAGDSRYVDSLLKEQGITAGKFVVMSAGARSSLKRWPLESFAECAGRIYKEYGLKVALVGEKDEAAVSAAIITLCPEGAVDLCGRTSFLQLAGLLKKSRLLLTNDSANLHCAGYLGVPAVAVFGPTDEKAYGPWENTGIAVVNPVPCRPCMRAQCSLARRACMDDVAVAGVMEAVKQLLSPNI